MLLQAAVEEARRQKRQWMAEENKKWAAIVAKQAKPAPKPIKKRKKGGYKPYKIDALDRRVPGSYGTGKRRR